MSAEQPKDGGAAGRAIIAEFNQRRQRLADTARKLEELVNEVQEHEMVVRTLEPMDKSRKCFRLISEVLVERTTGETLPAVKKNKEALEDVVKKLHRDMQQQEKELTEYQQKHKIKVVDQEGRPIDGEDEDAGEGPSGQSSSSSQNKPQGMLAG
ncbi:Prefoldin subunit-domain-containing protein [Dunaliella salina]|uniref:Prefoldin subunit-domain-containing protein n=1 Tax=Dunaliella salina TaxID=3046 RepID=A0ABQ7FVB1_DUNSA|nr:Prefoldin subunit-domain-containing protein [Dunaliella salina]|eukprot:KAF5826320.1 Prefoldin subunit-domain-containing protein [Dunaliella salina]